jgi:putative ATP-dependent endonuclease of OLD family
LTTEDAGLTTACRPASTPAVAKDDISNLERYLDATKSVLMFARRVILVEGMSEVFLVPCLVKQVIKVDLEEHGVSVVPIYGVHFDSYLKLFVNKGIRKKCAVITDGDLVPSDASEIDEAVLPRLDDLKKHESDFIRIFNCKTTFEQAIALPGNLKVFANAVKELGANTISEQLHDFYNRRAELTDDEKNQARDKVLNTANRFGKARFAQIASKYAAHAEVLPSYIKNAIEWIIS